MGTFLIVLLLIVSILMMGLILLQRGRGGGLAGALGGAGGQSALGTRAGDLFTRITIVFAVIWVLLSGTSSCQLSAERKFKGGKKSDPTVQTVETKKKETDDKDPGAGKKETDDDK